MPTATRVFNFSAGPAVLPLPVLEEAHRKITRLEIEREALKKESEQGEGKARTRVKSIDKEIADLRDSTREVELKWKNEKETG